MKKLNLIKKPELFQGEKSLKYNKNYFEGWYFKNTKKKYGISFIPGININESEKKAFIQIITNNTSYFVNYDIKDFEYNDKPFYIKIKNNYFSENYIHIDIEDYLQNLTIFGDITYTDSININTNLLNPNIMGPFSFIPFLECNHAILSMKNKANGLININNKKIIFNNDTGYIEKDWGYSFPKNYIWIQGNNFKKKNTSFMISIADIPFKNFNFKGFICVIIIDNKEYKFTTYNNAKLLKNVINNNQLNIEVKKGKYLIKITSKLKKGLKLSAPLKGKMEKSIYENITSSINIILKENEKILFSDTSSNCGVEIVQD